jgi:hypothetical protein
MLRAALPASLAAAVVAIVLGILGMHALPDAHMLAMDATDHAAMADAAPPRAHDAVVEGPGHATAQSRGHTTDVTTAGAAPGRTPDTDAVSSTTPVAVNPGVVHPVMGAMMMLCAAMLLSAGALLLLLFAGRRPAPAWDRLLARVASQTWALPPRVASTRPPPGWEFSVIRC